MLLNFEDLFCLVLCCFVLTYHLSSLFTSCGHFSRGCSEVSRDYFNTACLLFLWVHFYPVAINIIISQGGFAQSQEFQRAQGPDIDSSSHLCLYFPCCTQGSDKAPHSGHWLWHWIETSSANMHSPLTFLHVFPRGETISFQWLSLITPGDIYSYCFVWCKNMNICLDFHSTTTKQLLRFNYVPSKGNKRRQILFLRNSEFNKGDKQAKTEIALRWAPWYMQVYTRHCGGNDESIIRWRECEVFQLLLNFFFKLEHNCFTKLH